LFYSPDGKIMFANGVDGRLSASARAPAAAKPPVSNRLRTARLGFRIFNSALAGQLAVENRNGAAPRTRQTVLV
jgi:hypothetical protein